MCDKQKFKEILTIFLDENNIPCDDFDKVLSIYEGNFRSVDLGRNVDIDYRVILACIHAMEVINKKSPFITIMAKMLYEAIDDEIQSLKDVQTYFKYEYLGKNYEPMDGE